MTYPTASDWSLNDDLTNTSKAIVEFILTDEFKRDQSMNFETKFPCTLMTNTIKGELFNRGLNDFVVFALVNTESMVHIKYQPD